MEQVVVLTGRTCNGKSRLASRLRDEFEFKVIDTSELLLSEAKKRQSPTDRLALQELGDTLDRETNFEWVFTAVSASMSAGERRVVVDNIRHAEQLAFFRSQNNWKLTHVPDIAAHAIEVRRMQGANVLEQVWPQA